MRRGDPGPCPICDAAHCSCGGGGPIEIVQLPNRDAAVAGKPGVYVAPTSTSVLAPLVADIVQAQLAPGAFTSGTYRGKKSR